jgi:hypothetical protein
MASFWAAEGIGNVGDPKALKIGRVSVYRALGEGV